MAHVTPALIDQFRALLGASHVIAGGETLETLSKDFYWYSPILKEALEGKRAEVAVRPGSIDELRAVIIACHAAGAPLVLRGGGTGNYGQCIPLHGGVVADLSRLDRIHEITTDGVARCEPGARLGTIEPEARKRGWELRCLPSTWVKSSLAGFLCGGSGGIGSITWGGLGAPGTVKSVTVMTCEAEPRLVRYEEAAVLRSLHTFGTTGIMVEIELRLAPKVDYEQLIVSHASFEKLARWTDAAARNPAWRKRLVSLFEWPVPSFFKPLLKHLRADECASFLLVDRADAEAVIAEATAQGLNIAWRGPLSDPPKPPLLTDYTYNHTTLWAIKSDPQFTYIQAGFGADYLGQCAKLRERFPGEILFHFEWVAARAKVDDVTGRAIGEGVIVASIPIIRFVSEARLNEIIVYCREIGMGVANTHTFKMEDSGKYPDIADKYAFKAEMDPAGLLNPGKLARYPVNPFAVVTPPAA